MFSRFDTIPACDRRTDRRTGVQPIAKTCFSIADARKKINIHKKSVHVDKNLRLQRTDLNLDSLNKNLSELSAGMLRQGILNSYNDFV